MGANSPQVIAKILVQGKLKLESPLIIGDGKNGDFVDIMIQKDHEGKPFIPATSLVGVLRSYFRDNAMVDYRTFEPFWGAEKARESAQQSALAVSDLKTFMDTFIRVRDGVKIDSRLGIAEEGCKYEYEIVEPGPSFDLFMEITIRKEHNLEDFFRATKFLGEALEKGKISFGAMTSKGFGKCRLEQAQYCYLDFTKQDMVYQWLSGERTFLPFKELSVDNPIQERDHGFSIEALFKIKSSLIVRSYPGSAEAPDAVHITSRDQHILPGTSVKGAIRNRALRILNTIGLPGQEVLKELFGWVDTEGVRQSKIKSRVYVEETTISKATQELQRRIKIDRFTGGAIKSALFDSAPLWTSGDEVVQINFGIKKHFLPWEAGLLLLILKDLWTSDLALGGEKAIGRGVLQGVEATITHGDRKVLIRAADPGLTFEGEEQDLEAYVQALIGMVEKGGLVNGAQ